jgi:hypothetical protein
LGGGKQRERLFSNAIFFLWPLPSDLDFLNYGGLSLFSSLRYNIYKKISQLIADFLCSTSNRIPLLKKWPLKSAVFIAFFAA